MTFKPGRTTTRNSGGEEESDETSSNLCNSSLSRPSHWGVSHATPVESLVHTTTRTANGASPWRLVRAVLARSFQLDREIAGSYRQNTRRCGRQWFELSPPANLVAATAFDLGGPGLRQYHPAEFKRFPEWLRNRDDGIQHHQGAGQFLDPFRVLLPLCVAVPRAGLASTAARASLWLPRSDALRSDAPNPSLKFGDSGPSN